MSKLVVYRWYNEAADQTEYLVKSVTRKGKDGSDESAARLIAMQHTGVTSIDIHGLKGEIVGIGEE